MGRHGRLHAMAAEQAASSVVTTPWPNICPDLHLPPLRMCLSTASFQPPLCVCWGATGQETPVALLAGYRSGSALSPAVQWCCSHLLPSFLRPRAERGHPILLDLQRASWSKPQVLCCGHALSISKKAQSIRRLILGNSW